MARGLPVCRSLLHRHPPVLHLHLHLLRLRLVVFPLHPTSYLPFHLHSLPSPSFPSCPSILPVPAPPSPPPPSLGARHRARSLHAEAYSSRAILLPPPLIRRRTVAPHAIPPRRNDHFRPGLSHRLSLRAVAANFHARSSVDRPSHAPPSPTLRATLLPFLLLPTALDVDATPHH